MRMSGGLLSVNADLSCCPTPLPEFIALRDQVRDQVGIPQDSVTFGDKHGNVLRKIYELIVVGVLEVTEDQYNELYDIYNRHAELIEKQSINALKTDILAFKKIIGASPVHQHLRVIDIGDLFADRGEQDILTLILFRYLKKEKLSFSIHYSNHDDVMFRQYAASVIERDRPIVFRTELGARFNNEDIPQDRSWTNLGELIRLKVIDEKSVKRYIAELKCHLTLLSSELIDGHLFIRSHAPIDLKHIDALLAQMKIVVVPQESDAIVSVTQKKIAAINAEFKKIVDENNFQCFMENVFNDQYLDDVNALWSTIWSRVLRVVNIESEIQYSLLRSGRQVRTQLFLGDHITDITFMFGHVGEGSAIQKPDGTLDDRFVNIDSNIGKHQSLFKGALTFFYTGKCLPILELIDRQAIERERCDFFLNITKILARQRTRIDSSNAIPRETNHAFDERCEINCTGCCDSVSRCMSSFFRKLKECCCKENPLDVASLITYNSRL